MRACAGGRKDFVKGESTQLSSGPNTREPLDSADNALLISQIHEVVI